MKLAVESTRTGTPVPSTTATSTTSAGRSGYNSTRTITAVTFVTENEAGGTRSPGPKPGRVQIQLYPGTTALTNFTNPYFTVHVRHHVCRVITGWHVIRLVSRARPRPRLRTCAVVQGIARLWLVAMDLGICGGTAVHRQSLTQHFPL
eukprot:470096-Rhodomonas_salina.2